MKIETFLNSLGTTSQEIADSLRARNITGEKCNKKFCPIIKAIYHEFPNMSAGLVLMNTYSPSGYRNFGSWGRVYMEASYGTILTWNDCQTLNPNCPCVVKQFVKDFDNGLYPDLVGKSQKEIRQETINSLTKEQRIALGL